MSRASLTCAIYTRKSSEEGLEQDFNSIQAQREACEAFIQSQKTEGWKCCPDHYDDGGYSGGNMERPALKKLLSDIAVGKIQIVVVYKVDRLTRSLTDFARIVEQFDQQGISFVSVTQQFNTTSSMGRLTLNVLLSFAQFEREVTGERIRDKIAASKKKGMWMGGVPPMGYCIDQRTLVIHEEEAKRVREIYRLYLTTGCIRSLKTELDQNHWKTAVYKTVKGKTIGQKPFSRGHLYRILTNPVYRGQIAHKNKVYEGLHPAIIPETLWDQVQEKLTENRQGRKERNWRLNRHKGNQEIPENKDRKANQGNQRANDLNLLSAKLFTETGEALCPTYSSKGSRRYRYYVSQKLMGRSKEDHPKGWRLPAPELEKTIIAGMIDLLTHSNRLLSYFPQSNAVESQQLLTRAENWNRLLIQGSIEEQASVIKALIDTIVVQENQLEIRLNREAFQERGIPDSGSIPESDKENKKSRDEAGTESESSKEKQKHIGVEEDETGEDKVGDAQEPPMVLILPIRLRRYGLGLRLIVEAPGSVHNQAIDQRLLRSIERGQQWFLQLIQNPPKSIGEIAKAEQVSVTHLTRLIYLAFLSPDIVQMIRQGKQPPSLTAERLSRRVPLPMDWDEQRKWLGIPSSHA